MSVFRCAERSPRSYSPQPSRALYGMPDPVSEVVDGVARPSGRSWQWFGRLRGTPSYSSPLGRCRSEFRRLSVRWHVSFHWRSRHARSFSSCRGGNAAYGPRPRFQSRGDAERKHGVFSEAVFFCHFTTIWWTLPTLALLSFVLEKAIADVCGTQ